MYFVNGETLVFASRCRRSEHPLERNVGPEPMEDAIAQSEEVRDGWQGVLATLRNGSETTGTPAATTWNTPHLVVTGCMPGHPVTAAAVSGRAETDRPLRHGRKA